MALGNWELQESFDKVPRHQTKHRLNQLLFFKSIESCTDSSAFQPPSAQVPKYEQTTAILLAIQIVLLRAPQVSDEFCFQTSSIRIRSNIR
jgi:hypothetical protein